MTFAIGYLTATNSHALRCHQAYTCCCIGRRRRSFCGQLMIQFNHMCHACIDIDAMPTSKAAQLERHHFHDMDQTDDACLRGLNGLQRCSACMQGEPQPHAAPLLLPLLLHQGGSTARCCCHSECSRAPHVDVALSNWQTYCANLRTSDASQHHCWRMHAVTAVPHGVHASVPSGQRLAPRVCGVKHALMHGVAFLLWFCICPAHSMPAAGAEHTNTARLECDDCMYSTGQ